jgi:soluble lytic murein transglycosylase-like protein
MRSPHTRERHPAETHRLAVRLPDGTTLQLARSFYIGRDFECEVQLDDTQVSRRHAQVSFTRGEWSIRDLQSSNGLYVDGERVETAPIGSGIRARLGAAGPVLVIAPAELAGGGRVGGDDEPPEAEEEGPGERTQMFHAEMLKQRRKYRSIIAVTLLVAAAAIGYAEYVRRMSPVWAKNDFYEAQAKQVLIAEGERAIESGNATASPMLAQYMQQRREMRDNYEEYFRKHLDRRLNEKDRMILRVTRMFGECDLAAPPGYVKEVSRFIEQWRSTGRLESAIRRAEANGYVRRIVASFEARKMPPQYFYLALQESSFITDATGPPTRYGVARGMWQFIPDTGRRYGLTIGGGVDERLNWERATTAAASYIKDIYATDAEASGLLVMASYNWGEHRVIDIVRRMPKTPKERKFWRLIADYKIPEETYNYVFNIVSAAVIGENPKLFGFTFENPLARAGAQPAR